MRKLLVAATALVAVGLASTAWTGTAAAGPALGIRVFEDGVLTGLTANSPSGGTASINGSTTNFSVVSAFSTGFPVIPQPDFTAQTTTISSLGSFTGTHTIRLEYTQTDVTSASAGGLAARLASSFTDNFLIGGGVSSLSITNYADAQDRAFQTSGAGVTQLAQLFDTASSAPTGAAGPIVIGLSLPNALFSETVVIEGTFTGGGSTLQASSQLMDVPAAAAVPEPMSMALLGTGLLGLGLVKQRRRTA